MNETEILRQELENYRSEKERIRKIIGQIGGASSKKRDLLLNIVFLMLVILLFAFDLARELLQLNVVGIPPFLSIELAVLLVSVKIIWMIHKQSKIDHFQFWVLNSIEFQINTIAKKVQELDAKLPTR